ncbi:MAG: L,D-transpeptidase family protein [Deltaproteobacteria bacterium]|nr:L,D-transpeptidase family protein [Deltaproteobacteria bacterium]
MKHRFHRLPVVFLGLVFLVASAAGPAPAAVSGEAVSRALQDWLDVASRSQQAFVGCEPVYAGKDLVEFYRNRGNQPVWVSPGGPSQAARELVAAIANAAQHGLSPQDYHFSCLSEWLKHPSAQQSLATAAKGLAGLEIVLSDAFVNLATHLAAGKVDPETIHPQWISPKKKTEVFRWLDGITASEDLGLFFDELAPNSRGYRTAMIEARRLRRQIAAGKWQEIAPGATLRPGDRSPRVAQVRARLANQGDLPPAGDPLLDETLFDDALLQAVIRFQNRHGLSADGIVGPQTLAALNRSPRDRLRCVLVNLERWRWLPRDLGRRHIIVNSAAFELAAFREGRKVLEMPVIVGETYTRTPVFSQNMTSLVVNPYWNVPPGVLARKILPKIKKDPGYLAANHFELLRGWKQAAEVLDPRLIDWSTVHPGNFPGRLRQRPGPWNALGRIKFIFPNDFAVYLHDTPDRHLFERTARAFSSGCIRVKKPIELALFVLEDDPAWDRERLERVLAEGGPKTIPVKNPVTVHLQYWTFWIGDEGEPQYRKDIYNRDGVLWNALNTTPAASPPPARVRPEADPNTEVDPAG